MIHLLQLLSRGKSVIEEDFPQSQEEKQATRAGMFFLMSYWKEMLWDFDIPSVILDEDKINRNAAYIKSIFCAHLLEQPLQADVFIYKWWSISNYF